MKHNIHRAECLKKAKSNLKVLYQAGRYVKTTEYRAEILDGKNKQITPPEQWRKGYDKGTITPEQRADIFKLKRYAFINKYFAKNKFLIRKKNGGIITYYHPRESLGGSHHGGVYTTMRDQHEAIDDKKIYNILLHEMVAFEESNDTIEAIPLDVKWAQKIYKLGEYSR